MRRSPIGSSLRIGRVFGIDIGVHLSWFIIFFLVTYNLGRYFQAAGPEGAALLPRAAWFTAVVTSLVFFSSIVAHELGHSIVAIRNGVPVKGITLFVFGGVAQITREPPTAKVEFAIAIAGPLVSAALGFAFLGIYLATRDASNAVSRAAYWTMYTNLAVAVFNLLPGFPLDGGRVFRSIVWGINKDFKRATKVAVGVGRTIFFILMVVGTVLAVLGLVSERFSGWTVQGVWLAIMGWFLGNAAAQSYGQTMLRDAAVGRTAADLMVRDVPSVSGNISLQRFVDENLLPSGQRFLMVGAGGLLEGIVSLTDVRRVPKDKWPHVSVRDIMTPMSRVKTAQATDSIFTLLQTMDQMDINQVPVMESGRIVGLVAREGIIKYIRTRVDLAG